MCVCVCLTQEHFITMLHPLSILFLVLRQGPFEVAPTGLQLRIGERDELHSTLGRDDWVLLQGE